MRFYVVAEKTNYWIPVIITTSVDGGESLPWGRGTGSRPFQENTLLLAAIAPGNNCILKI